MTVNTEMIKTYIMSRLSEASTWRGLTLIATVAGLKLSMDARELILMLGLGTSGLIGVLFPDAGKK